MLYTSAKQELKVEESRQRLIHCLLRYETSVERMREYIRLADIITPNLTETALLLDEPSHFPGTGDAFTSIVTGSLLQGEELLTAIGRAMQFISTAMRVSLDANAPVKEGMLIESVLHTLKAPVRSIGYEFME